MMNNFEFSVVIATYNRPSLLGRCVQSVIQQKEENIEIIAIDDASNIDYKSFLNKYPFVKYKKLQNNSGPSVARNIGINLAKTDWVIIIDDDDELLPGAISFIRNRFNQFNQINNYPVIQFASSNAIINKQVKLFSLEDYISGAVMGDFVPVINRRIFIRDKLQFYPFKIGAESVFWCDLAEKYRGIPSFSKVICKLNSDARTRLSDISSQIKSAREFAKLQKNLLNKFSQTFKKYPKQRLIRMIGYVVYSILAGNRKGARFFLVNDMAEENKFIIFLLWLLSFSPYFFVRWLFKYYRKI